MRVSTHCNNENVHAKCEVLTDHMYNVDGQINHVRTLYIKENYYNVKVWTIFVQVCHKKWSEKIATYK